MAVEIAAVASSPEAPITERAIGRQQVRTVTKPRTISQPQMKPPPPEVLPELALSRPNETVPEQAVQQRPAEETSALPSVTAPRKTEQAAPVTGGSSSIANVPQTWESLVLAQLQRFKRYPGAAEARHEEDLVYVRITLDERGRLLGAKIARSRGFSLLDQEVLSLVHRASPFPAPPPNYGTTVDLEVPVEFFIRREAARL